MQKFCRYQRIQIARCFAVLCFPCSLNRADVEQWATRGPTRGRIRNPAEAFAIAGFQRPEGPINHSTRPLQIALEARNGQQALLASPMPQEPFQQGFAQG